MTSIPKLLCSSFSVEAKSDKTSTVMADSSTEGGPSLGNPVVQDRKRLPAIALEVASNVILQLVCTQDSGTSSTSA